MIKKIAVLMLISILIGLGFAWTEREKSFDRIDNYYTDGQYIYFSGTNPSGRYVCKADFTGRLLFARRADLTGGVLFFLRSPASTGAFAVDADENMYMALSVADRENSLGLDERIVQISANGLSENVLKSGQSAAGAGEIISLAVYGKRVWYAERITGGRGLRLNYIENNAVYPFREIEANPIDAVITESGAVVYTVADKGLFVSYTNGLISKISMDGLEEYDLSSVRAAGKESIYLSSLTERSSGIEMDVVTGEVNRAEYATPESIALTNSVGLFALDAALCFLLCFVALFLISLCASRLGAVNGLKLSFCLISFAGLLFAVQHYGDKTILKGNTLHLRAETEAVVKSLSADDFRQIDWRAAFGDETYLNLYYRFYEKLIPVDSTCFFNIYLADNGKFYKAFSKNGYVGDSPAGEELTRFETVADTNEPASGLVAGDFGKTSYILTPLSDDKGVVYGIVESGFYYRSFQIFTDKIFLMFVLVFAASIATLVYNSGGFSMPLYHLLQKLSAGNYGETAPVKGGSAPLIRLANNLSKELKEKADVTGGTLEAYEKFLPADRIELTGESHVTDLKAGLHKGAEGIILIVNLRKYTGKAFADKDDEFRYVNTFMESCAECVCDAKGVLLGFREYGVISVFGKNVGRALEAALRIAGNNPDAGIAVVYADSEIGAVGSESRRGLTAVSQTITEAAEFERYAEELSVRIVISEKVKAMADKQSLEYNTRPLIYKPNSGELIYDLFDADDIESLKHKRDVKRPFEKGVGLFLDGSFGEAGKTFVNILKYNSADRACRAFALLCDSRPGEVHK